MGYFNSESQFKRSLVDSNEKKKIKQQLKDFLKSYKK